jgi:predicted  nucleic acid-binding Zn-ribbon protein
MAEETENLILRLLRDIRAKQDDHDRRFGATEQELRDLRKSIEDWQETTSTGVGFAAHANIRTQAMEREIEDLKRRIEQLERAH